ncbi:dCMP deaminase family protein [Lentisphaerota bacterium ZTH]|nr:dCMP deaminase family protein [Lentisphaerota bacterium]WET05142.1 dCMP deaminase family protein [Lentisphaerota bacterium ZTH]
MSEKLQRPDWDNYFMNIAMVVAARANCSRRQVAAVIVKDKRIISTGYNGTPRGIRNCHEGGCSRCSSDSPSGHNLSMCVCSHAEENAIVQAAYHGISVKDSTLYTTFSPCLLCAKMIINSGIQEVVYHKQYTIAEQALELLREAGILVRPVLSKQEKIESGISE